MHLSKIIPYGISNKISGKVKNKKWLISITCAAAFTLFSIIFIFTSCMGPMGSAFTDTPDTVQGESQTFQVTRGNISQEISVTGSVDSKSYTTLNLRVSGEILEAVEAGYVFKEGELLVQIDDSEKQDSLFEIEKNLEISESSLKLARLNYQSALDSNHIAIQQAQLNEQKAAESTENTLKSLEISMRSADASVESAERALEEAKELLEMAEDDPAATEMQLAQYESNVKSAEEKVGSAKLSEKSTELQSESSYESSLISQSSTYWSNLSSLQSAEKAITQAAENLKQTEIKLELAKREYENAKKDLGEYTAYAPYDGIVVSTDFVSGAEASGGGSISIISTDFMIKTMVSESDIIKISIDQESNITLDAYPDIEFTGDVEKIIPIGSEEGNIVYYEVTISFRNETDIEILYGMSANIYIIDVMAEDVLYVPLQAVYKEEGKSYVDVLLSEMGEEEATRNVRKTEITTGVNDYYYIEVISGLSEGNIIITSR
jgi:HlyD family secretion protein